MSSDEIEAFQKIFLSETWRYGWAHRPLFGTSPAWHIFLAGKERMQMKSAEAELAASQTWGFVADIWRRISDQYAPGLTLVGAYANAHTPGLESAIHRDNVVDAPGLTALIFPTRLWPSAWGGETVFYDQSHNKIIKSVLPKPGTLVLFDGRVPHNVRAPSSQATLLRTSVAFKTINSSIIESHASSETHLSEAGALA